MRTYLMNRKRLGDALWALAFLGGAAALWWGVRTSRQSGGSLTTAMIPVALGLATGMLIVYLIVRRRERGR
jgi:hypothetical protein